MLTRISMKAENDIYRGGIVLSSKTTGVGASDVARIEISRKDESTGLINTLLVKQIESESSLNFSLFDITSKSGGVYSYYVNVYNSGNTLLENDVFMNVKCHFEGLFVGNPTKQYVAGTNFKTETKRNIQVEYVTTLASKYPYRISNSDSNYTTGTSSGLFLRLTEDKKKFVPDNDHSFSDEVIEFLCDGQNKVVKTHDGQAWLVSIDASPSKIYSDYIGMNAVSFNWTEIGELSSVEAVIDNG